VCLCAHVLVSLNISLFNNYLYCLFVTIEVNGMSPFWKLGKCVCMWVGVWNVHLWDRLVDVDPSCAGVDVKVSWVFLGQRVGDGRIGALIVVVSRRPQEASPNRCVLSQEVWHGKGKHITHITNTHYIYSFSRHFYQSDLQKKTIEAVKLTICYSAMTV